MWWELSKLCRSAFIADDELGDEYQKVLMPKHLSFLLCRKRSKVKFAQVILVYIFITWNNIFLYFQNCYKLKNLQRKISEE